MPDPDLPNGWYTAEDGSRRYWDGANWLVPAASTAARPEDVRPTPEVPRKRRGRTIAIVVAVLAVLAIGGGVAAATSVSAAQAEAKHVAAVKHAKAVAAERAAAAKAAQKAEEAEESAERESRTRLISSLEKSVKKTAKKDVTDGVLTGPILDVTCTPLGGGSTDDLTQKSATFQCFAANKKNDDGTENGYNFSATANWDTGEYTWRLGN